ALRIVADEYFAISHRVGNSEHAKCVERCRKIRLCPYRSQRKSYQDQRFTVLRAWGWPISNRDFDSATSARRHRVWRNGERRDIELGVVPNDKGPRVIAGPAKLTDKSAFYRAVPLQFFDDMGGGHAYEAIADMKNEARSAPDRTRPC